MIGILSREIAVVNLYQQNKYLELPKLLLMGRKNESDNLPHSNQNYRITGESRGRRDPRKGLRMQLRRGGRR